MKKKYILLGSLVLSTVAFSQVGINTKTPQATLDVEGKATTITAADGIIAPRITGNQLRAKNAAYTQTQNGTLVYVTAADTAPATKTINVTAPGYYYYDQPTATAGVWRVVSSNDWKLTGNASTNPSTNFVGTTDTQPLAFRVNNSEKLRITPTGRLDFSNTSGSNTNLFIEGGNETTTGNNNYAFGINALIANTTGNNNYAFGNNALSANTTGENNYAFGISALSTNTTAADNIAFGSNALRANTTGSSNQAFGHSSLSSNTTGFGNNAFGYSSLFSNTIGVFNTAFGTYSLRRNTTGSNNTAFGYDALRNDTTGRNNTAIGYRAGLETIANTYSVTTESNSIFIGTNTGLTNAMVGQNNLLNIGNLVFGSGVGSTNPNTPAGNIGIGVQVPTEKLEVAGAVKIATTTTAGTVTDGGSCTKPGTMVYHDASQSFYGCAGTTWKKLHN